MVMGALNRGEILGLQANGMDAMQLPNFQPLALNEDEVPDLGGAEPLPPVIETRDRHLASLIRSVGTRTIRDIKSLVEELQKTRDYLQSEGERVQAETVRYIALTGAASASVKIIFDALRAWRTADHSAHNQSQASAFEIMDAVIEDASDWGDGPSRSFG